MIDARQIEEIFRDASELSAAGDFARAEARCRLILNAASDHAPALYLIGLIAKRLGHHGYALDYFERAVAADPTFRAAQEELESARADAARPAESRALTPRFLVSKAWGYGFWADINHLCGGLLLAEITGRTPLTHWGDNSLFSDGTRNDAFRLYFEPISACGLDDLPLATPRTVFPPKWAAVGLDKGEHMKLDGPSSRLPGLYFLGRPEAVVVTDYFISVPALLPWLAASHVMHGRPVAEVYRYLAAKYLKPKAPIVTAAGEFLRARLAGKPAIAVHMRGSDKLLEAETTHLLPLYFQHLDREDRERQILLLTDDTRCVAPFKQRYGARVILSDVLRTSTDLGVHHMPAADRVRLGHEVMVDTYAALACERFLGNGMSNLSAFVSVLKPWDADACVLLGGSILNVGRV